MEFIRRERDGVVGKGGNGGLRVERLAADFEGYGVRGWDRDLWLADDEGVGWRGVAWI